jgi:molybdopterin-containing oxidoreductase family iron-sulfur binding subunit
LADDPSFRERLHNEFPSAVEAITDETTRRTFMKLMGASMALAGLTGCTRQPEEKIVPYVRQPEELVPGKPLFYATAMSIGGTATGLLVETHEGRPTKVEGNPLHPASLGACDVFGQAAILDLYDPDRARTLSHIGDIRPWSAFLGMIRAALVAQQPLGGAGIRILTEAVSSPTLAGQIQDLLKRFPAAKWHQWDPAAPSNTREGAKLAFGDYVDWQYRVDQADVIVSLDADFLGCGAGSLRYAREFASRRRPEQADRMNRLYAIEVMPTSTGARADHRLPVRPTEIGGVARQIASILGVGGLTTASRSDETGRWAAAVAKDLQAHRGASLVIVGESQPPEVHALAHAMNQVLGNVGRTIVYTDAIESAPVDHLKSIRELTADMDAGHVDLLIILGGNPVYTAPVDVPFGQALGKVQTRVHLSLHEDETSELCHWQIPQAHFLEAWSDGRAFDGTASIVQPLIAPLYGGRSAHDVLAAMSDRPERPAHEIVREHWMNQPVAAAFGRAEQRAVSPEFERAWRKWLHDGVIPNTASKERTVTVRFAVDSLGARSEGVSNGAGLDISFRLDPSVLDGRFANNGWLQELPKPITKLTWDNAVIASPATAAKLKAAGRPSMQGGEHGQIVSDVVLLTYKGKTLRGPIFVVPGHADDCVTVHLGYGRSRAGHVGNGAGFNAYSIRTADALWSGRGVDVASTGDTYPLACTQYHHLMEGRGLVRVATRDEYIKNPKAVHEGFEAPARCTLTSSTRAISGGWRSTSTPASGAMPASSDVSPRTTSRSSARTRCCAAGKCTGCGWTRTTRARSRIPRRTFSRCPACSARTRRARSSARSAPPCTATKG